MNTSPAGRRPEFVIPEINIPVSPCIPGHSHIVKMAGVAVRSLLSRAARPQWVSALVILPRSSFVRSQ